MTVEWDLDMSVSWVEIKIGLEKLCLSAKLFFFFNLRNFVRAFHWRRRFIVLEPSGKNGRAKQLQAKLWNVFNVFFFQKKQQLEINHFYGHNKISSLKHALY